jgi:hypothetical protein
MARRHAAGEPGPIDQLINSLSQEELAEVVLKAVERNDDVEVAVRLLAVRANGDLGASL